MEVQKGIAATLRFPEVDADPVSLSGPTVTVVRDSDGATIVDKVAADPQESDAFFTHDLSGSEIPEVDLLRVTWADADSSIEQQVEVVGGFACSLTAIKKKLDATEEEITEKWPDDLIVAERERATRDIESACWQAFRQRYEKETLSGDNGNVLVLNKRRVVKVLSLEVDGVMFTDDELEELAITEIGLQRRRFVGTGPAGSGPWSWSDFREGTQNIVIAYVYGHENFPSASNPVRDLTADYLVNFPTNWEERATSYTDADGNNYRMVTAGEKGRRFNLPTVNAFVEANETTRLV